MKDGIKRARNAFLLIVFTVCIVFWLAGVAAFAKFRRSLDSLKNLTHPCEQKRVMEMIRTTEAHGRKSRRLVLKVAE